MLIYQTVLFLLSTSSGTHNDDPIRGIRIVFKCLRMYFPNFYPIGKALRETLHIELFKISTLLAVHPSSLFSLSAYSDRQDHWRNSVVKHVHLASNIEVYATEMHRVIRVEKMGLN